MRQILFCRWYHFQWSHHWRSVQFANDNAAFGHLQKLLWNNQDLNILKSLVSSNKKSSSGILYLFIGLFVNLPIYLSFISMHLLVNISVSWSSSKSSFRGTYSNPYHIQDKENEWFWQLERKWIMNGKGNWKKHAKRFLIVPRGRPLVGSNSQNKESDNLQVHRA